VVSLARATQKSLSRIRRRQAASRPHFLDCLTCLSSGIHSWIKRLKRFHYTVLFLIGIDLCPTSSDRNRSMVSFFFGISSRRKEGRMIYASERTRAFASVGTETKIALTHSLHVRPRLTPSAPRSSQLLCILKAIVSAQRLPEYSQIEWSTTILKHLL